MNTSLFFLKDNFFSRFRIKIKSFAAMFSVFKSLSDSNLVSDTGEQHAGYEYDNEGCFRFLTNAAVRFFGFKAAIFTSYDNGKEYVLSDYGLNEEAKEVLFQSCVQLSQETSESISFLTAPISNKLKDLKLEFIDNDRGFFVCQLKLKDKQGQYFGNLFLIDHASRKLSALKKQDLALMADQAVRLIKERTSTKNLTLLNNRLQANIKLLEQIQQSNKIGYWCLEIASGKTEWSDLIYDIYEVDRDFVSNKENGLSFYHPEYVSTVAGAIDRCISTNEPFDIQCLLITAKGNQKWVRSAGFKNNNLIYGSFQDISDIKVNELKFEGIFNTSASLIWFLDLAGLVLDLNATSTIIIGGQKESVRGKALWDCPCFSNINTIVLKNMLAEVLNGREVNCELEITTEDNQLFPVIFSLRPILNQSKAIAYVLAEARPIKELAEKTKRYEAIIQGANVGTWEWNIQTGEVLINNNWAKIIGYELEELIPMSIEKWRSLIHPEDLPFVERELVGVNWKSNNFFAIQMRIKHKLG
ncbi:MAG: PAS domain-containing protein, partial [Balneolales bacterium]|nr:PAS domain-containing protein [Balneolales bacterium]